MIGEMEEAVCGVGEEEVGDDGEMVQVDQVEAPQV